MGNDIVKVEQAGFLSPVVSVKDALFAYQAKKDLIDGIMKPNVDYGIIPGTSKNTLLKAGAEKATSFFGLSARFRDAVAVEDFTGKDHDGEPFFFYRRTCELWRGDYLIASVDGSCNSFEKKYRYRGGERVCPICGKATIIKGKEEYGGGWLCFAKRGGCGQKFGDKDQSIIGQEVGQIKNPDVADLANTILKMADKRALVAATLIATGLSEYFTQDVEDFITGEYVEVVKVENPNPVNNTLWNHWVSLCNRADKVNIKHANPDRVKVTEEDLIAAGKELRPLVEDAERQAAAENVNQDS